MSNLRKANVNEFQSPRTINKGSPVVTVRNPRNLRSAEHGQQTTDLSTWRDRSNSKPVSFTRKQAA